MQHDGDHNMYYTTDYSTPIGRLTLAADKHGDAITGAWFDGQKYFGGTSGQDLVAKKDLDGLTNYQTNKVNSYVWKIKLQGLGSYLF